MRSTRPRERAAIKKDRFDEVDGGDPEQAKETMAARQQLRERMENSRRMQGQAG